MVSDHMLRTQFKYLVNGDRTKHWYVLFICQVILQKPVAAVSMKRGGAIVNLNTLHGEDSP